MANTTQIQRFWLWLRGWVWALVDAIPPYTVFEGHLEAKTIDSRGKHYISVACTWTEVDDVTSKTLSVGDRLRIRRTKGGRAVNIDRIVSRQDPSTPEDEETPAQPI